MRKHPSPRRHFVVSVLLAAAAGLLCESALAQGDAETGVWPIERTWTKDEELTYSQWVAELFATQPDDKRRGWRNLAAVLRDKERNSLWGSLGLGEDDISSLSHVKAKADCADVPYTLRAYYAWKRRLPLRYSRCTRGDGRWGPHCRQRHDNRSSAFDHIRDEVARWNAFVSGELVFAVHSGTLRTLPHDETSDFYPLPLSKDAIRPGTVFVDVGSHVLVITGWDDAGPTAIDGHPDGTVTIKRFSEKSFPYYRTLHTGGFKAFRPIAPDLAPLSNAALGPQWSTEQYELGSSDAFYEAVVSLP
ncbi:MAG: hypothetical protein MUC50_20250 [Myxococcota bacterium]|nr:hypothetical protein [Myxococcota bacterium]